ncbi:hypothetical protein [Pseudoteredinibacter isoporae]|uniref:Ribosomal 50S subunit-recycling heat shock protein n=1 Tax=Pseudoteredinibacter isoporae TaxID=570281 RepID=A0A7X0JVC7_9GAMM|nr:hypothetical protein [Pseudoteredinibacter isoporae]MBB6522115.1 ribosomal 50S subunit-recycling heat shock protein [Pseudoteredinibacter isoporae]NHO87650.1 hypothetical protein [Pseudoteredinibacter isoporae]NIB24019.1 hypothetical protein [Pseudoteredinibacter isoporae]
METIKPTARSLDSGRNAKHLSSYLSRHLLLCLTSILMLAGCSEQRPDLDNPITFQQDSLRFSYPGNWKIIENRKDEHIWYINLESPGTAVITINIFDEVDTISTEEYAETVMAELESTFEGFIHVDKKSVAHRKTKAGDEIKIVSYYYTLDIATIKVPHLQRHRKITSDSQSLYMMTQTPIEDKALTSPGFKLINSSISLANQN